MERQNIGKDLDKTESNHSSQCKLLASCPLARETLERVDNGKHKTFQVQGEVCQAAKAGQRQRNRSLYWATHPRGSITSL